MDNKNHWDKLRDAARGRRCFIVGSAGTSTPLDPIPESGDITILCCGTRNEVPALGFAPTLQVLEADPDRVELRILDPEWKNQIGETNGSLWTTVVRDPGHSLGSPHFSKNAPSYLWDGGAPEYLALQIAYYLECAEFRLQGEQGTDSSQIFLSKVPTSAKIRDSAPTQGRPSISVIVCTEGRTPGALENCLRSLSDQEISEGGFEIVLVDTGDQDFARKISAGHSHLVYAARPGADLSGARNFGVRIAAGEIVAFLDDRAEASKGWLRAIEKTFKVHERIWATGGRILPSWGSPRPAWFKPEHLKGLELVDFGDDPQILRSDSQWLPSGNCAYRRIALEQWGGFESRHRDPGGILHKYENQRLQERIRKSGKMVTYDPDLVSFRSLGSTELEVNLVHNFLLSDLVFEQFHDLERRGQQGDMQHLMGMLQRQYADFPRNLQDRKLSFIFDDLLETAIFLLKIPQEEKYLRLACYEEKKSDLSGSIAMLAVLISANPQLPGTYLTASKLFADHGLLSHAQDLLWKALEKFPNNEDVLRRIGPVFLKNRHFAKAEQCLTLARKLAGTEKTDDLELVRLYSAEGSKKKAIEAAERILGKFPEHFDSLLFAAGEYLEQDRRESFLKALETLRHWMPRSLKVKELEEKLRSRRAAGDRLEEASRT